jgi:hypothetical protein
MPPQDHKAIRAMLLAVLVIGLIGTGMELLLLEHDESLTQLVPLVLIGVGLAVIVWHASAGSHLSMIVMRVAMVAFIVTGVLGIALHYKGSAEFQKELDPSVQGFALFVKAVHSKAPPALAPGTMAQLGLLGLVCTYQGRNRRENI